MALSPLSRLAGMLSVTAAVLIVLSQVMRLGVNRLLGLARFIWAIRTLRTPPSGAPGPLTDATTDLIPATR